MAGTAMGQNSNSVSTPLAPTEACHLFNLAFQPSGVASGSCGSRIISSQTFDQTENRAPSQADATNNGGLAEPRYVFPDNMFTDYPAIPPVSHDTFKNVISQQGTLQYSSTAPVAQGQLTTTAPYAGATAPLANIYPFIPQPLRTTHSEHSATTKGRPNSAPVNTATFNAPLFSMPRRNSTAALHSHPTIPNTGPDECPNTTAGSMSSFNAILSAPTVPSTPVPVNSFSYPNPGFPMRHPNYNSMSTANVPATILNVNLNASMPSTVPMHQYTNQQMSNAYSNARSLLQPRSGYVQRMPPAMNCNWNVPTQNTYPQHFMASYPSPMLQNMYFQGLPMQNGFAGEPQGSSLSNIGTEQSLKFDITTPADMNNTKAQSSISTTQFIVEGPESFSGASGGPKRRSKGRSKGNKKRLVSTPELSPTTDLPQSPGTSTSTTMDALNHVAPDPNVQVSTNAASTGAAEKMYICRWEGCRHVLRITKKRDYSRHLAYEHGFHGAGRACVMTCPWTDGRGRCGKELQMQSLTKHVCETHLNCLGTWCPLCDSHQARVDNMARHLRSCVRFQTLPEDEQRWKWKELVKGKPFQYYLDNCAPKRKRRSKGKTVGK